MNGEKEVTYMSFAANRGTSAMISVLGLGLMLGDRGDSLEVAVRREVWEVFAEVLGFE